MTAMGRIRRTGLAAAALWLVGLTFAAPASAGHGTVEFLFVGCFGDATLTVAIDGEAVGSFPILAGVVSETVSVPEGVLLPGPTTILGVECSGGAQLAAFFGSINDGTGAVGNYTPNPPLFLQVSILNGTLAPPPPTILALGGETDSNPATKGALPTLVAGKTETRLAQTGSESIPLVQQGLGLVAIGGFALFAARRRQVSVTAALR